MSETLRAVADRQAITDQIHRYCRAVDRLDHELGYAVWHEDGLAHYEGFFQGTGRGLIDKVCEAHRHLLHHSHQVTNVIIDLEGDRASSEAYVTATLRHRDAALERLMQVTVWARYADTWSRRDGCWRIDKRITILDFDEIREVIARKSYEWARRGPADPSYAVLASKP